MNSTFGLFRDEWTQHLHPLPGCALALAAKHQRRPTAGNVRRQRALIVKVAHFVWHPSAGIARVGFD